MTRETIFSASNNYVQKKEYVPESATTVIETENKSLFKQKSFILGVAVGAILVSLIAAIVVVILKLTSISSTSAWSYEEQDEWPGTCLTGTIQSPIALFESDSVQNNDIPVFVLKNVDYFGEVEVENSGHTVNVKLIVEEEEDKPKLSGAGLSGNFTLSNIHFHWPSEHTINGKYYDLEAHLVFYNEEYESLEDALPYQNAVTVIGILFQETDSENVTSHDNFEVIDQAVERVYRKAGSTVTASGAITISDFFPTNIETYFQYTGSDRKSVV